MFWRVFMRISYSCPAHLKFGLTVEQWTKLVTLTGEAIDWLDVHEEMYDVWLLVAYAATSCALVQVGTDPKARPLLLICPCSTTPGYVGRIPRLWGNCVNYGIASEGGRKLSAQSTCQLGARSVFRSM